MSTEFSNSSSMYTCKCSPYNTTTFLHAVANYISVCVTVLSTAGYTELTTSSIQQVSLPDKIHGTSMFSIQYYCVLYVYDCVRTLYKYELHCLVLCVNTHVHV